MKPRILFASPTFGRTAGGLGVSAERITRHLTCAFDVIALVPDPMLPAQAFEEDSADTLGRKRVRFWWKPGSAAAAQFFSDVVCHYLQEGAAWAAAFYVGDLAFPLVQAARFHRTRSALFARGNDVDLDLFSPAAFHAYHALSHADRVFAVSREMCRKISAFAPSARPTFVGNGVDTALFQPTVAPPPEDPGARLTLGLFGEIKRKKGLDLLLETLDFERFELRIVGRLHEEVAKYLHGFLTYRPDLIPRVRLIPYREDPEALVREYHACDAVCVPSVHDGMPNVLVEAMACGRVCVASGVGGALDLVEDGQNGFLFRVRSSVDLARALATAEAYLRTGDRRLQAEARRSAEERASGDRERRAYLDCLGGTPDDAAG